jgi:lipopolysaccharide transport system ATP-binding protein
MTSSKLVIKVENLSKQYRLGLVGTGTFSHDLNRWWARMRGRPDPYLKIGEENDRTALGESEYVWALQDINFEVRRGEVLGIVGRNGAGKSTLLKILSKITAPTTGCFKSKGRISSLLEVGTGFHPELTGRENIYINGTLNGLSRHDVRARLDEIVDFAGVARYIDTPVKRYSSGMTVRLGFAVAAFLEPEILIIDEVLAVGDAEFQKKALGKMQSVTEDEGRTILFVSHNLTAVKSLCSRAVLLENGRLTLEGSPDAVISSYMGQQQETSNYTRFPEDTGVPGFRLIAIGARARGKDYHDPISRDEAIEITIEYDYYEKIAERVDVALHFKADDGNVFMAAGTGLDEVPKIKLGHHVLSATVPAYLLSQGLYALIVRFGFKPIKQTLLFDDAISFNINPEERDLGQWMGKGKGYVRPLLQWA